MIPAVHMFEVVVATAFYCGLCYMVFEGTGMSLADYSLKGAAFLVQSSLISVSKQMQCKLACCL